MFRNEVSWNEEVLARHGLDGFEKQGIVVITRGPVEDGLLEQY